MASSWKTERADRLTVIIDAHRYFEVLREALLGARHRVMLVGWDFDARVRLSGEDRLNGEPETVGEFLYWLVERTPGLEVHLLRWDIGALKSLVRGSTFATVLKWMRHPRIHTKLDGHHPTGGSHHQKIVSVDDCLAFCGGIDLTGDRWDTRAHADDDPKRVTPSGQPYKPWHDAIASVTGPAATALSELCRSRWRKATGETLPPVTAKCDCWPPMLPADFENVPLAIARSIPTMPGESPCREVEELFLEQIAGARHHVYVESQYFASRRVAEAIARRLDEEDGPEFVIVNPVTAQGWLEPLAMDTARDRLMEALRRRDGRGRLAMYHPVTERGEPIYVHAKIMVVDGHQLRIGSANMNNRSLRLDTECDLMIEARDREDVAERIRFIRDDLIAEHLGVDAATIAGELERTGSLIAAIEALRAGASGRTFRRFEQRDLSAIEAWLADKEILDPEGPEEMFETLSRRGLFRRIAR